MKKLVFVILFFSSSLLFAQQKNDIQFRHFSVDEGLSTNSCTAICQDSIGFMWFGTYYGLNRFDGYTFKQYLSNPEKPGTLSNSYIRALLVDKEGNLWVGSEGKGLNYYHRKKDTFISFQHDPDDKSSISNHKINSIIQDRNGNIWIATWGGGLNRIEVKLTGTEKNKSFQDNIDKLKFIRYRADSLNPNSVAGDKISRLYLDKEGLIWIATQTGLSILNPSTMQFENLYHDPKDKFSLSGNDISSICEDKYGNVWVGTWGFGLNKYIRSKKQFIRYSYSKEDKSSISNNKIMKLYQDRSGNLWIGTWGGGLNKLSYRNSNLKNQAPNTNMATDKFIRYQYDANNPKSFRGQMIYDIYEDRSGVLWIGTNQKGVNSFDKGKIKFKHHKANLQLGTGLNENTINSFYKDKSGNFWIGTSKGINVYVKNKGTYSYYLHDPKNSHSISDNNIYTIYEDNNGTIWIGTEVGVNKFDEKNNRFEKIYLYPENLANPDVRCIYEDKDGMLWFGTFDDGLVKFDRKNNKNTTYLNNPKDSLSLSGNIVPSILEVNDGTLWIATNAGLNRYDRKNNTFIRFTEDTEDAYSIPSNTINCLYQDSKGELWLGTAQGLSKLIKSKNSNKTPRFRNYNKADGLPSDYIAAIIEDEKGNLWISTSDGISKFNPTTEEFNNYDVSDGLQEPDFIVNSVFRDKKTGYIYFGGYNGYNYFLPDDINDNLIAPPVVISDLKIYNNPVQIGEKIDGQTILTTSLTETKAIPLSYKSKMITFEFAALHFNSPENNQYAYKLLGFDKDWHYVGNKREATYTNLDPGEYTFWVKASNNDGVWNEEGVKLKISILPPWWETTMARIGFILLIMGLFTGFYLYRINQLKIQKSTLEKMVEERTDELKIQAAQLSDANTRLEEQSEELKITAENVKESNKLLLAKQELILKQSEQLKENNRELSLLNATKDQLFSIIAHDLKSPFNSIIGLADLLNKRFEKIDDNRKQELIGMIHQSSKRLFKMLENLLQWARSQTGKIQFEPVEILLDELIDLNIALAENMAKEKKIELKSNFSKEILVFADWNMLDTVVRNLISNAIKFTEEGSVNIDAYQHNGQTTVSIIDTGVGIDKTKLEKIFDVMSSKSTTGTKGETGTGLGLILCKEFIKRHNGTISAKSELGKGSTFSFTIPSKHIK